MVQNQLAPGLADNEKVQLQILFRILRVPCLTDGMRFTWHCTAGGVPENATTCLDHKQMQVVVQVCNHTFIAEKSLEAAQCMCKHLK